MQEKQTKPSDITPFETMMEITTKEEVENLIRAFEDAEKGKNKPKHSAEEIQEILRKSKENFCRRHNIDL